MRDVEIDQSKKSAKSDHVAEDRQAEFFNPQRSKRNFLIGAEPCVADCLLGDELVSFLVEADENIGFVDHGVFDGPLIISEIGTDPRIADGGIVVEEKSDLIA